MSSRRSRLARRKNRNAASQFEQLEPRRLLTTLSGGESFVYFDSNDELFLITLGGNITAEFVGASVTGNNLVWLDDLVGPPPEGSDITGRDLFAVYVTRADAMSWISIVQLNDDFEPTPFDAGQDLNVVSAQDGDIITVGGAAGAGAGYLGARTIDTDAEIENEEDRPILFGRVPVGGLGVLPAQPGNVMGPGVTIANGQNIGSFLFDGTVSGRVTATGSVGTFYAGQLLTGQTSGQFVSAPMRPRNFTVNGDLRNLVVKGPIGTSTEAVDDEPEYFTGFDLQVRGVVGQIRAASNITGTIDVRNALGGPFLTGVQREIEFLPPDDDISGFLLGLLGPDPFFDNNAFETAQYLSSYSDPAFGGAKAVRVAGSIDGQTDSVDFFGLPLLAGQTVTVQIVTPSGPGFAPTAAVWDPDQRLIASNENPLDYTQTLTSAFSFTADRPGVYRFSVGDISELVGEGATTSFTGEYSLRLTGTGDIGLGAVATDGNYLALTPEVSGIKVYRGDFGALRATEGVLTSGATAAGVTGTIDTPFSSIRSVEGASIGTLGEQGQFGLGLDLEVPSGNVGQLRTTAADGILALSQDFDPAASVIGGSYQLVQAANTFYGVMAANRGIGVIRAGNMATLSPTIINVNFDNRNADGIIDLIDVTGDFGSPAGGGPQITTNDNGNVRYLRVGGEIYRDFLFGSGLGTVANTIVRRAGEELNITDDSGAIINVKPHLIPNPNWNPADPNSSRYIGRPATFSVTSYPIRGSGGSVITNIDADRSVVISSLAPGGGRSAEIGRVNMTAGGAPVIFQQVPPVGTIPGFVSDRIGLDPSPGLLNISVYMTGAVPVDVLELNASGPLNTVQNTSGGEMPIVRAPSIGDLYGSSLGIATPRSTPTAVNPTEVLLDTFPFQSQRIGILAADIVNIAATQQLGNIIVQQGIVGGAGANSGTIGSLVANSDGIDQGNVFEGIVGPVLGNDLRYIDIGEGVAASGSGQAQRSGLFANTRTSAIGVVTSPDYFPSGGRIEAVRNRGRGDIRGTVVAENRIQSIQLTNGSLIGTTIGVYTTIEQSRKLQGAVLIPQESDSYTAPVYDINEIVLTGNGGIIGTFIEASDIDLVWVRDGFGILTSEIGVLADGRVNRVVADGYGIRNTFIGDGAAITEINATGNGAQVNQDLISSSVRLSEFGYRVDPFFGHAPNQLTDIHHVLGTTRFNRNIDNVTNSGIIDGLVANGSVEIGALYAQRLRNSTFHFANSVNLLQTRGPMRNLEIVTGRLGQLNSGGDVAQIITSIAGPIADFYVNGSVDQTSHIRAIGPSGRIGRFQANGFLAGDITTTGVINQLTIGRDVLATSRIETDDIIVRQIGGEVFGQIVIT